jgi:hypothetical protein
VGEEEHYLAGPTAQRTRGFQARYDVDRLSFGLRRCARKGLVLTLRAFASHRVAARVETETRF